MRFLRSRPSESRYCSFQPVEPLVGSSFRPLLSTGVTVRRALSGPGLWPGPRRQARWAGRGLRRSRVGPEDRFCEAVRNNHAPLRGAAVGYENWVLASGGVCRSEPAGVFRVIGRRRVGRKGCTVAGDGPPVVTADLWTVRGRVRNWCWGSLPGNPRCCCVRVCQSPVLTRGSGGRRACSHPVGGAAAGGGRV